MIATSLLLLFLLVLSLAQFESLHRWMHPDTSSPDHQCFITLLAKGQIDVASPVVGLLPLSLVSALAPLPDTPAYLAPAYYLLPARGPPARQG